jgi:hypothetical protein
MVLFEYIFIVPNLVWNFWIGKLNHEFSYTCCSLRQFNR